MGPHSPKLMADRNLTRSTRSESRRADSPSRVAANVARGGLSLFGMSNKTTSSPTNPTEKPVADETQDLTEVRLEKLREIEALGIDPWGHASTTPRRSARSASCPPSRSTTPSPGRRSAPPAASSATAPAGKLLFLEIWDQTGRVQLMVRVNKVTRDRVEGRATARPRRPDRRGRRVRQDARPAN